MKTGYWIRWVPSANERLVSLCFLLLALPALGADPVFTSIGDIRALESDELVKNHTVLLEGVVLGRNPSMRRMVIQEQGMGLGIIGPRGVELPGVGARIRLEGVTIHAVAAEVAAEKLTVIDPEAGVPEPKRMSVSDAVDLSQANGQLVTVSGFAQAIRRPQRNTRTLLDNRDVIELRENHRVLSVLAPGAHQKFGLKSRFGEITATGVLSDVTLTNSAVIRCLRVLDLNRVSLDREGPTDPFDRPVIEIEDFASATIATNREPIRIRGRITETLEDGRFSFQTSEAVESRVLCRNSPSGVDTNAVVDLLGYPIISESSIFVDVVLLRKLALPATKRREEGRPAVADYVEVTREIPEVHALTADEVDRGLPVNLLGRVSYRSELERFFYLQHYKGKSVRVLWRGTNDLPVCNDVVRVTGLVTNGIRYPRIVGLELQNRGQGNSALPTRWIFEDGFRSGKHNGRRVKINGVVRSVRMAAGEDVAVLKVVREGTVIPSRVQLHGKPLPIGCVDAEVVLHGVCSAIKDSSDSVAQQFFLVQETDDVLVTVPGETDPFANRQYTVEAVLENAWDTRYVHRVRVDGVVTHVSRERIFVDDGTGGIEVRAREESSVRPGDRVITVGFPTRGMLVPFLDEAIVRRDGVGELEAEYVPAGEIVGRELNGRYLRTRGEVTAHLGFPNNELQLRDGGVVFHVDIPEQMPRPAENIWPLGARIELVGVCEFERTMDGRPLGFRLLLNDAESVVILAPPPWWTPKRIGLAVAVLVLVAMGAVGWAAYFRNRAGQNRRQFLATFHANPMPAWIVGRQDLTCVELNGEFEKMFAVSRKDVIGRSLAEMRLWISEVEGRAFVKRMTENPSLRAEEANLRSRDGKERKVLLSTEPIEAEGEECVLLIAYDVTERLRLLEQLRQSQKMEAIGQLAAGVAHDFNNLMTVVRGNAGLLLLDDDLGTDSKTLTGEIEEAAGRAAELTGQMLAFSRKSIMNRRVFDLRDVIRTAAGMLNRMIGETIEVSYFCPDQPVVVKADSGMLDQVLLNLGVNARDAMPDGGALSMSVREVSYSAANLPHHADATAGNFALVEVRDTGTGMSDDVRRHAFEPFFTTKDVGKGTGLGLSTAYGILRQHGGWIDLETEPDEGCNFKLHLPICNVPAESEEGEVEFSSDVIGRGDETILVVDDQEAVRQAIQRTLEHYGYTILLAEDGATAESLWQEKRDEVDLVLTDLVLPNGVSGLELGERLRGNQPDLRIIYMTGHSQELLDHAGDLQAGVDFLPKPFENRELVRIIRERLDGLVSTVGA